MEDVQSNKKKMKELEDNLLYRLTSTKVMETKHLIPYMALQVDMATELAFTISFPASS
jgi:dynein heavy chain